jgi:predicted Rossmann-fold nucleotide-binding protein
MMVTIWSLAIGEVANRKQSLVISGGGGGNRTAGSSRDSDDSRTVSGTGIDENTSKEHEQNALPDILVTMSQIPDVNRELAEVVAMFAVFDGIRRERGR